MLQSRVNVRSPLFSWLGFASLTVLLSCGRPLPIAEDGSFRVPEQGDDDDDDGFDRDDDDDDDYDRRYDDSVDDGDDDGDGRGDDVDDDDGVTNPPGGRNDCAGACAQGVEEWLRNCLEETNGSEKCHVATRDMLAQCDPMCSNLPPDVDPPLPVPQPAPGMCECEAQAVAFVQSCVAQGNDIMACIAKGGAVLEQCRDRCQMDAPFPGDGCAERCEAESGQILMACIATGIPEPLCHLAVAGRAEECRAACGGDSDREQCVRTCEARGEEVERDCRRRGGGGRTCAALGEQAAESCIRGYCR